MRARIRTVQSGRGFGWLARVASLAIVLLSLLVAPAVTAIADPTATRTVRSQVVTAPPPKYDHMGCGTKQMYSDTTPRQDFLCGSAPGKTFKAGPNDVVYATGARAKIHAGNRAPNQIHGLASGKAYIDLGINDCPVYGITARNVIPPCNRVARKGQAVIPPRPTTAQDCRDTNPDLANWVARGWRPQFLSGVCHFTVPPDVKCQVSPTNGNRIVSLSAAPRVAAQDANPEVVDWQIAAWSMVIYQRDTTTNQWRVVVQTSWYWDEPTDIFDVRLRDVPLNNWRRFGSKVDGTPAQIIGQPFLMPSAGQYKFQILEQWYRAPASRAGLNRLQYTPVQGFYLSPFRVSASFGAEVLPTNPSRGQKLYGTAVCLFP